MTGAWGGLTSSLFNLLHSKKYKADRHSKSPFFYITGYKKGLQEHISPRHQKRGADMHTNSIFCAMLSKILKLKEVFFFFFFLQITTHHSHVTSFISPSMTERSLLESSNHALLRSCNSPQGSHYLQNSTCQSGFTRSVIVSQLWWRGS